VKLATVLGVSASLALVLGAMACPRATQPAAPRRIDLLMADGVRVQRISPERSLLGPAVSGRRGDLELVSDHLRLVVGARSQGAEADLERGAVLDLTHDEYRHDLLRELKPRVSVRGTDQALATDSVEPYVRSGRAGVRVAQVTRDGALEVVTEIEVGRGEPYATLVTRVKNRSRAVMDAVQIGDRVRWLFEEPYAPGAGWLRSKQRLLTRWYAVEARPWSYALVFTDSALQLDVRTATHGAAEQLALGRESRLESGQSISYRRHLVVAGSGLPGVSEVAWRLAGIGFGRVSGRLSPVPSWAIIEAFSESGAPLIEANVARDGTFTVPVPAGPARLVLRTPGGKDEERVVVGADAAIEAHFLVPQPGLLRFRAVDEAAGSLAVRVGLLGVPPTADPELGPPHRAAGAGNAAYFVDGEGTLELPPGSYEVLATHGPEYDIERKQIEVDSAHGAAVRATLRRVVDTTGWVACDFHLHADPSGDSEVSLADRVISLLSEGIELAVATDHNHVTDYAPAVAKLGAQERVATARGVEITTPKWGHFNAFPLPPEALPPPYADIAPAAIFSAVRSAAPGAVIQINHPRMRPDIGYFDVSGLAGGAPLRDGFSWDFDTIEVFNGFELSNAMAVEQNLLDWLSLIESGRRYTAVGNSDSHRLVGQWTGYPRTYVRVDDDRPGAITPELIAEALRRGRAFVTTGPIVDVSVAGRGLGELVPAPGGRARVDVRVQAAPWVDVQTVAMLLDGKPSQTLNVVRSDAKERAQLVFDIEAAADAWLVVLVRGKEPLPVLPGTVTQPFAFTNPIYLDVDGDGAFRGATDGGKR
jgi:hypothetical protein